MSGLVGYFADIGEVDRLVADFDLVGAFGVVVGVDFDRNAADGSGNVIGSVQGSDLLADQAAGRGQTLLSLQGLQRASELVLRSDRPQLADLLNELRVVHWIERILMRQLADHELQELVDIQILQIVDPLGLAGAGAAGGACCSVDGGGHMLIPWMCTIGALDDDVESTGWTAE